MTRLAYQIYMLGAAIGVNSALIAIVTDWLSDIKMGYCSTGWWLNQKYCCWEIEGNGKLQHTEIISIQLTIKHDSEDGGCEYWVYWSQAVGFGPDGFFIKWLFYTMWAVRSCMR